MNKRKRYFTFSFLLLLLYNFIYLCITYSLRGFNYFTFTLWYDTLFSCTCTLYCIGERAAYLFDGWAAGSSSQLALREGEIELIVTAHELEGIKSLYLPPGQLLPAIARSLAICVCSQSDLLHFLVEYTHLVFIDSYIYHHFSELLIHHIYPLLCFSFIHTPPCTE